MEKARQETYRTPQLEEEARAFMDFGIEIIRQPLTIYTAWKKVEELALKLGPPEKAFSVLEMIHRMIPAENHVTHNGDHDHAIIARDGNYEEGQGPLFIVSNLPPNSNRILEKHNHPPDLMELVITSRDGLEVVTEVPRETADGLALVDQEAASRLVPIKPFAVPEGILHTTRNAGPKQIYTTDIRVLLKNTL